MAEKTLLETVTENAVFVAEFAGIVIVMVAVAYVMEKMAKRRAGSRERILSTRKVAVCGMFSAIAAVLMVIEVPVPFAPPFYGLDLSELPVLIGTFAFGPVAGVLIEFCKINGSIGNITTFVIFAVAPLNLLKGGLVSVITMFLYKKISPILKEGTKNQK